MRVFAQIYTCQPFNSPNDALQAVTSLLKSEDLYYSIQCDAEKVMTLTKGKASPVNGFVIVVNDHNFNETVLFDIYDLVKFIETHGLRIC